MILTYEKLFSEKGGYIKLEVALSIDKVSYKRKPEPWEIAKISKRIPLNKKVMEISEAAAMIGNNGHTFTGAVFKNGERNNDNVAGMQLFAIDFDHDVTYNEIIDIINNKYHLPICFSYYTFSSSESQERFRVVFCLEFLIEDIRFINMIINMIMDMFPKCDRSCSDSSRLFFGGKGLIDMSFSFFTLEDLIHAHYISIYASDPKNVSRKMRRICKIGGISLPPDNAIKYQINCQEEELKCLDNYMVISGQQSDSNMTNNVYYFEKGADTKPGQSSFSKDEKHMPSEKENSKQNKIKIGDFNIVLEKCRLAKEFFENKDNGFDHKIRFALLTNIYRFKGMKNKFLDAIERSGHDRKKWKIDFDFVEKKGYNGTLCENYCPYCDECPHDSSLFTKITRKGKWCIRRIAEATEEYISIETARCNLYDAINNCCQKINENSLIIIKAQPGLGKTYTCCNIISSNLSMKFCIAVPTNTLKHQIEDMLITLFNVPQSDIYACSSIAEQGFPVEVANEIKKHHQLGIHNSTKCIIDSSIEQKKYQTDNEKEMLCKYSNQINRMAYNERVLIVTHAKLCTLSEDVLRDRTVIIDEDILEEYCFHKIINVDEESVRKSLPYYKESTQSLLQNLLELPANSFMCFLSNKKRFQYGDSLDYEQMETLGIKSNVNDLLEAISVQRTEKGLRYLVYTPLPHASYILLSATADVEMYRKYYGNLIDISVYDGYIGTVQYKGSVIQYPAHVLGRNGLKMDDTMSQILSFVSENYEGQFKMICFKQYQESEVNTDNINNSRLYYGNLNGLNDLEGNNLVIIGTPFVSDSIYKLIAAALGADCQSEDFNSPFRMRKVEYNGYSFPMMTSKDPIVQDTEFHIIYSQLEQAIGRARLLDHDSTVLVFSGFPCSQAEIHEEEYLKKNDEGETEEDVQEADKIQADKPLENSKKSGNRNITIEKFVSVSREEETRYSTSFQSTPWAETPRPMCGIEMCKYLPRQMCGYLPRVMCDYIRPQTKRQMCGMIMCEITNPFALLARI